MRTATFSLALVFVLFANHVGFAQTSSPRLDPQVRVSRRIAPAEASHRHSSTAYEGALRGQAAWISAYGDYLQDESQAAYTWQHVESMHYDNKLKKTATALTRKQMLSSYRELERTQRRNRRAAAEQLSFEREFDLAKKYQLNDFEFNWATGAIYWPTVAASPRYASHRQKIAVLMNRAVRYGAEYNQPFRDEISKACHDFRMELKEAAAEDHPSTADEYLAVQRFLKGLRYAPLLMAQVSTGEHLANN